MFRRSPWQPCARRRPVRTSFHRRRRLCNPPGPRPDPCSAHRVRSMSPASAEVFFGQIIQRVRPLRMTRARRGEFAAEAAAESHELQNHIGFVRLPFKAHAGWKRGQLALKALRGMEERHHGILQNAELLGEGRAGIAGESVGHERLLDGRLAQVPAAATRRLSARLCRWRRAAWRARPRSSRDRPR